MNTDEIIQKSVSGAKWTVILSILAMPLGYIVNIILGRISPEALGIYGLLNIFIVSITTFILFGGGIVIIKYLPEIDKDKKVSFLLSYILIVFLIAIFAIGLIYLYPQILDFIFGQAIPSGILPYLIIFIPIIILYFVFDYALNGLMELKTSVVIRKIITYGNFVVFVTLFLFCKDFFREQLWAIIWGLSFVFYIVLGLLALFLTKKKMKITSLNKKESRNYDCKCSWIDDVSQVLLYPFRILPKLRNFKLYLPTKFWSFALFVHLSTIVDFSCEKIDQLFILSYFSIRELGLYYAALQTAMLIRFVPMLLGSVLLPTFSNLLASNEIKLIQKGYREVIRYNTLMIVPASLLCIFFSRQIMGIFGAAYVQNHLVLVVLGVSSMVCSMGGVNSSLIMAKGRTGVYLLTSIMQAVFGFSLMFFLIGKLGVLGLAIGRGAGVVLAQVGLIFIVCKLLNMGIKIPRAYIISIFTAILVSILYFVIHPTSIIISTILFLSCLIFFLYFGGYSLKDVHFIFRQARR
ncbi:MAG: oligosaccharide flippase family protein [Methanophagales archaeon]|nr:oligosaccharide flippase family protein [Methanophagales archaeon]